MKKFTGLVASKGLAIGKAFRISDNLKLDIPSYSIDTLKIKDEKERLKNAIEKTIKDLTHLLQEHKKDSSKEETDILNTHIAMLKDEEFIKDVYNDLEKEKLNVESILDKKLESYASLLAASANTYIKERAMDIKDAFSPVFECLLSSREKIDRFSRVPPFSIIVARDIMTSEVLSLKKAQIKGIIMEEGGVTGHISIIARSWGLPMLVSTSHSFEYGLSGLEVILDAEEGFVIYNPSSKEIEKYKNKIEENEKRQKDVMSRFSIECGILKTADGIPVSVSANIAFKDEVLNPSMQVADGVGLFRTEFLFLKDDIIPDEKMQEQVYSSVAKTMKGKPVIIRTFDAGSDKMLKEQERLHEKNPLLGWRAIRYCFERPQIFKTQIRAILRSSAFGNIHILIPMVSSVNEVKRVKNIIEEEKSYLKEKGIPFNDKLPLGIMVEVPSVAIVAEFFAPYVDFMSIGTNDLVQYVMAVDRENGKVSYLANYFEPSVLRLIKKAIDSSSFNKNKDYFVSMCGEMACNKEAVFLLLGMGLRHFSMPSWKTYEMKEFISSIDVKSAEEVYNKVLNMENPEEILACVKNELSSK